MFERIMNYFGYQKVKNVGVEPTVKPVEEMDPILKNAIERINAGENIISYYPDKVVIRISDEYEIVHIPSCGDSSLRWINDGSIDWDFFSDEDKHMICSFLCVRTQNNMKIYKEKVYNSVLGSKC